jgi:hypothetical protein
MHLVLVGVSGLELLVVVVTTSVVATTVPELEDASGHTTNRHTNGDRVKEHRAWRAVVQLTASKKERAHDGSEARRSR